MSIYDADAGRVIEQQPRAHKNDYIHDCKHENCPPKPPPEVVVDFTRQDPDEHPSDGIARGLAQLAAWFMNAQKKD